MASGGTGRAGTGRADGVVDMRSKPTDLRGTVPDPVRAELQDLRLRVAELEKSERMYRLLAQNVTGVVLRIQGPRMITWVSDSATRELGWRPAELVGVDVSAIVHPDDIADFEADLATLATEDLKPVRRRFADAAGAFHWVQVHGRALVDDGGNSDGFVVSLHAVGADVAREQDSAASGLAAEEYRFLAENAADVVMRAGSDLRLNWVSPSVTEILGWEAAECVGRNVAGFFADDEVRCALRSLARAGVMPEEALLRGPLRVMTKSGSRKWMAARCRSIQVGGAPGGVVVSLCDVTELVDQRDRRQAVLDTMLDAYLLITPKRDEAGKIVDFEISDANRAAAKCSGTRIGDPRGASLRSSCPGLVSNGLFEGYIKVVGGGEPLVLNDFQVDDPGPDSVVLDLRATRVGNSVSVTWRDVTERHEATQSVVEQARTDALTGLLNRRVVLERLSELLQRHPRTGGRIALAFCDIDNFKAINDHHGHAAGDDALRLIAERLEGALRGDDIVARFGGDELLVILTGIHDLHGAVEVAERLRLAAAAPIVLAGRETKVSMSIGVTMAAPGEDVGALMARSDSAMYRAKRAGRNRVVAL